MHLTVNVVLGDLNNERDHKENTDKVGDHHKSVEGIGDVPSKRGGKNRTEDNGYNVDNTEDVSGLCAKEVLPSLGAVMGPAENGGEGKEEHCDSNELATDIAPREHLVKRAADESCIGVACGDLTGLCVEHAAVKSAGGKNNKCGHSADYHGIRKYLEDTPHTLLNGLLNAGVGMYHNGGTETCLVREYAALEAVGHSDDNTADTAANECLGGKCVSKNSLKSGDDSGIVDTDDNKAARYEKNDHKGNDLFGNVCDSLNAAEGDNGGKYHNSNTEKDVVKRYFTKYVDGGKRLNIKCRRNVCNYLVYLTHATDTEGCEHGKDTEEHCKDLAGGLKSCLTVLILIGITAHTVLKIVHRASGPFTEAVFTSEINTENVFCEVCHHSEEGCDPHPEDRARAADCDSSGNTCDVTGTDSSGKCRTKRLEGRNNTLLLAVLENVLGEKASDGVLPPKADVRDLEYLCAECYDDAGAYKKRQSENAPYHSVDAAVYGGNLVEKCLHCFLLKIKI